MERLLTTKEVSELLSVSEVTLRRWRVQGSGPDYLKGVGGVRYDQSHLRNWLQQHHVSCSFA